MTLLSQTSRPHVAVQRCACRASRRRHAAAQRQPQPHTVSSPLRASAGDSSGDADDDAPVVDVSAWRDFRAKLVAAERDEDEPVSRAADRWAHSLPAVEQGCVLIANPSLFATSQTYFRQAVIFIYSHSDSAGSAGIILNRATEKRFRDVTNNEQFKDFSDSLLWLGGDVGRSTMHVMHPEHIGGTRVVPGVAMGGFDAARLALLQGRMERDECRFFTRYSGWGPGQLADEVAQGVWFVAACSANVILEGSATPAEMWADVLTLMGGEYARMAATTLAEE